MRSIQHYLNAEDEEKIRRAVAEAESHSRGEIVTMIVHASDHYGRLRVAGGIACAVAAYAAGLALFPSLHPSWFLLIETAGFVAGSALCRLDGVMRLFLTNREREAAVYDRALHAFYHHALHTTREATGILILASLLERRVQIIADRGIHDKVGDATWRKAAEALTRALKEGRVADGFCDAIAICGEALARHFPAGIDNPNELPDRPIQGGSSPRRASSEH
ncbi:MAG TPA: TPM domain-containing protein [Nitrospiria bacterium]|nr:TPM domain-containing protein [Nitrospiria bacterium]